MREITDHKLSPLNEAIKITASGETGAGGAPIHYSMEIVNNGGVTHRLDIQFQNGPPGDAGFNGFTGEALLAIQIDRLRAFQAGPFACGDNQMALRCCEQALAWLQKRTRERLARGVEGTNQK